MFPNILYMFTWDNALKDGSSEVANGVTWVEAADCKVRAFLDHRM